MQRRRIVLLLSAALAFIGGYLTAVSHVSRPEPHTAYPMGSADVPTGQHTFTNRLAGEKSPYLLQHAHNPVDWYPWGDEAFRAAREADKPIFLSVGYSTCYWCHVMEREVFEDTAIARHMNERVVSIKVDREERPDIDRIYMAAVQAMTGSGGWPMSVFMTPEGKPFFGATYIPPRAQYGRPGFPDILQRVSELWKNERHKLLESGESLLEHLKAWRGTPGPLAEEVPDYAFRRFAQDFDSVNGGFGGGPKFPRPSVFNFLLRYYARTGERTALEMTLATLTAMAGGGMYDHIGGGFHRYAVDGAWRVPHFEKMLYDQAQLVCSYLEAYQITQDRFYAEVAVDVLRYVRRELTHPEGGFLSAEDAESAIDPSKPHAKEEGAFYLWTKAEVERICGSDAADILAFHFGIEEGGNAPHDPMNVFSGKNILYLAHTVEQTAEHFGKPADEIRTAVSRCRSLLFEARRQRPKPHLDDKVLTSWNGLMISAFARAAQVLGEADYRLAAEHAARFVQSRLMKDDRLLHRYRDGDARYPGGLEDYAFFTAGLLDLYESSFDPRWLEEAVRLARRQHELFWDEEQGGFFDTPAGDASLLLRTKEEYDGAEPAGNAVAAMNLLRLAQITGDGQWGTMAQRTVELLGPRLASTPEIAPQMLCAVEWLRSTPNEIVIAGAPGDPGTHALLGELWGRYLPHKVVTVVDEGDARQRVGRLAPYVLPMKRIDGRPTAYVCVRQACQLPTTDPRTFGELLEHR